MAPRTACTAPCERKRVVCQSSSTGRTVCPGVPYYYADEVYYTWDSTKNSYVVVDPPMNAANPSPPPSSHEDLIIYPKNGQDAGRQAADRYDCHSWAKAQTGFDPTQATGGVPPANVASGRGENDRAMCACLTARGYEVR
jgi:hypothetical protein